jgi:hypothetical protein
MVRNQSDGKKEEFFLLDDYDAINILTKEYAE